MTKIVCLLTLLLFSLQSQAVSQRTRAAAMRNSPLPLQNEKDEEKWPISFYYGLSSDFADQTSPRSYTHFTGVNLVYLASEKWSVSGALGFTADLIDGQIQKRPEQSYSETINPSLSLSGLFADSLSESVSYSFNLHVDPFFDSQSRYEAYRYMYGLRSGIFFSLAKGKYLMGHSVDFSELVGDYSYDSRKNANPDTYYTYSWSNSFRPHKKIDLSYSFVLRLTRLTNSETTYSYNNNLSLSTFTKNWVFSMVYSNGGFTEQGEVNLWYLDQYRRVMRFLAVYNF